MFFTAMAPAWARADHSAIDLMVQMEAEGEPIPITVVAVGDSDLVHDLFARAEAGEFGEIAPFVAPPAPVPESISDRQFAAQARNLGLITQAEALAFVSVGQIPAAMRAVIDALPTQAARDDAELTIAGARTFERHHPLTEALGNAFRGSLATGAFLDGFFAAAAQL